ncbi:MAG: hypothetical protein K2X43_12640 [Hyphomonadaceae bacterium]|jgi:predicted alpha-1,6-mannanase (GH76 family)|nr:hypothetical protein [Hyphomonadaceae bacterium]
MKLLFVGLSGLTLSIGWLLSEYAESPRWLALSVLVASSVRGLKHRAQLGAQHKHHQDGWLIVNRPIIVWISDKRRCGDDDVYAPRQ